jgi:hypothetical protein
MKFYIQQSALDRLVRLGRRMDATSKTMAQISSEPAKGFVEVVPAVPRCKTCQQFKAWGECANTGYPKPVDGSGFCDEHEPKP